MSATPTAGACAAMSWRRWSSAPPNTAGRSGRGSVGPKKSRRRCAPLCAACAALSVLSAREWGRTHHPKTDGGIPGRSGRPRSGRPSARRSGWSSQDPPRSTRARFGSSMSAGIVQTFAPLPDVARQILDAAARLPRAGEQPDRRGDAEAGLRGIADPVLPVVAPGIHRAVHAAGGGLPFLFPRQPPAGPVAAGLGLPEAHPHHRLVWAVPAPVAPMRRLRHPLLLQPRPAGVRPPLPFFIAADPR